tara:strand:+ start:2639 stop:2791 length:153 start_codon:yes stop_codon:yes gene_type:complete
MKKVFNWKFLVAFVLGFSLSAYGLTFWQTMLIIAIVAIIVESIIYFRQKK